MEISEAFRFLNVAPRDMVDTIKRHCHDTINYKYHIGGNFYKVPKKDIRVIKRGVK